MEDIKDEKTEAKTVAYPNSKLYWFGGWVYDFTKIATFFVFFFLLVHYFLFTIFIVKVISMNKTMTDSDMMLVDRIRYKTHPVERGDIIALYFPGEDEKKFVKRIIGLPNEKVTIVDDKVLINDTIIRESYLNGAPTKPDMEIVLEKNEYFVMGDNREASSDSRIWGPLPKNYIIGVASYRLLNINATAKSSSYNLKKSASAIRVFIQDHILDLFNIRAM